MQHFVRVMQGYMANQIILVTWQELQQALDVDVHSLDDLLRVHSEYLHKALFRFVSDVMKSCLHSLTKITLSLMNKIKGPSWVELTSRFFM